MPHLGEDRPRTPLSGFIGVISKEEIRYALRARENTPSVVGRASKELPAKATLLDLQLSLVPDALMDGILWSKTNAISFFI
jgi:hypothetical protein